MSWRGVLAEAAKLRVLAAEVGESQTSRQGGRAFRALDMTADEPSPSCACAPEPVAGRMIYRASTIMPSESSELHVPCSPCLYGTICSRSPSSCSSPVYVGVCARGHALQRGPCQSPRIKKEPITSVYLRTRFLRTRVLTQLSFLKEYEACASSNQSVEFPQESVCGMG